MMRFPFGETVTVKRPGGTTRYGDSLPGTEHTVDGVGFAPRNSSELRDGRNTVIVGLTGFAPPGADIQRIDQIARADGTIWEVEGELGEWRSPFTGWQAGIEFALRMVVG